MSKQCVFVQWIVLVVMTLTHIGRPALRGILTTGVSQEEQQQRLVEALIIVNDLFLVKDGRKGSPEFKFSHCILHLIPIL